MKKLLSTLILLTSTICYSVSTDFKTLYADEMSSLEKKTFSDSVEHHINFSGKELNFLFDKLPKVKSLETVGSSDVNEIRILEVFKGNGESAKRLFFKCRKNQKNTTECSIVFIEGTPAG